MALSIPPTAPSQSNDPVLSIDGPSGVPADSPWGDPKNWAFQLPDPKNITAYRQLGCEALLHPKTVSGRLQLWKLQATQAIKQRTAEPLGKRLMMDAATFGGSLLVFGGTLFLANRSPDPKHFFLKNLGIGMVSFLSISLAGIAVWKALLDTFEASILSFLMRRTDVADIKRLNDCRWLQHFQQPSYVHKLGGKAKEGDASQMLALPNDIDLGTSAVMGAALSTSGTGAADQVMAVLSMFIGAGIGRATASAAAALARGAAATRAATAFRATAGAF